MEGADKWYCPARARGDAQCGLRAGWGTDHLGYGLCRKHGGNMLNARKSAYMEEAMHELERVRTDVVMGIAMDIDPMDALLACVRIAAGEVAYATYKVQQLDPQDAVGHPETVKRRPLSLGKDGEDPKVTVEEVTSEHPNLHVWIRVRQGSLDRLAKFSKMALDAGVAKRQVELAEGAGDTLALELRKMFDALNMSAEQEARLPDLVRSMLENLERPMVEIAGQAPTDE